MSKEEPWQKGILHGFIAAGDYNFDFQVCDTESLCDTATVSITVNPLAPLTINVRVSSENDDAEE